MCEHHAGLAPGGAASAVSLSRRSLLRRSAAATLTIGVPAALLGGGAAAATTIKASHGTGFCNLGIFLTHARQLAKAADVALEFVATPTFADQVTLFGAGQVDLSVVPYTNFLTLVDAGAPVVIVAGGGVQGCVIVAGPGLDSPAKLKGKSLGTFQADTLEILPYDYLKKAGMSFKDVQVRYMGSTPEAVEAFAAGALDWMCTIEPYGQTALARRPGSVVLSDGTDIYGPNYPDCVLAARRTLLERNPEGIKAIIKAMMTAQHEAESNREQVLRELVGSYYKTTLENARIAADKQPVMVDMRAATDFILKRADSLLELGYIKKAPDPRSIDWSLLEQVIAENKELYGKLKVKSA